MIIGAQNLENKKNNNAPSHQQVYYNLIYLFLYLAIIYLLIAYQTRPIAYFILIGLMAVVTLLKY